MACITTTESEERFLFECSNYTKEREFFRTQLVSYDEKYDKIRDGIELLKEIFSSKHNTILTLFGKFLNRCWEIRYLMASNLPKPSA